jgi:FdhD protein
LSATVKVKAVKVDLRLGLEKKLEEYAAVEAPINIYVNGEHLVTLLATPTQKRELAVGYLLDEGIVRDLNEIKEVWVKDGDVKVETKSNVKIRIQAARTAKIVTTACGSEGDFLKLLDRVDKPFVRSSYRVKAEDVVDMVRKLNLKSEIFKLTGGVHSAMLFADGGLAAFSEDVGRHNAVDKVVGAAASKGVDFARSVIVTSGRQPADIVLKAARMGVPILVSIRGPVHSGILAAEKTGVTLICFARGQRMNIYTFPERILRFTKLS